MTSFGLILTISSLIALLPVCTWAQVRQPYVDSGDPFGVRYVHSRVPSTARRNPQNKTAAWDYPRGSPPSYIYRTAVPSTSPPSVPPTLPPFVTTTTRPPVAPTAARIWYSPPSIVKKDRLTDPRATRKPSHYTPEVDDSEVSASTFKKWGQQHLRPSPRKKVPSLPRNSEYRGIAEGSYFDRSNSSAPSKHRNNIFDWDSDRAHRHRHGHGASSVPTTQLPLSYNAWERYRSPSPSEYSRPKGRNDDYQEFRSRSVTYRPPRTKSRGKADPSKTTSGDYHRPFVVHRIGPVTVDRNKNYNEREHHPSAMSRGKDSVVYLPGSYYPTPKMSRDWSRSRRSAEETDIHPFASLSGK